MKHLSQHLKKMTNKYCVYLNATQVKKHLLLNLIYKEVAFFLVYYQKCVDIHVVRLFDLLFCLLRSRGNGFTVAVLLSWEPPREGDLPVHNYRVTWMSRRAHTAHKQTHTPLHAHTHTVQSNLHTRPTHSRTAEQGKKESNSRVTQGVRKHF